MDMFFSMISAYPFHYKYLYQKSLKKKKVIIIVVIIIIIVIIIIPIIITVMEIDASIN